MNSALLERVHGFLKRKSVSHSVAFRVKKGDTPASSSSQFSIGVHSAARFGANVAAPPLKFQFVAAPISRIAAGSSSTPGGVVRFIELLSCRICPKEDRQANRIKCAAASARIRIIISVGSLLI